MSTAYRLILTSSQKMALTDVVLAHMRIALSISPKQRKIFLAALTAGIEMAIVRNNLEMEGGEIPAPSDAKRMATDAVNAMQGIDTCDPQPIAEWNALVDLGGSTR